MSHQRPVGGDAVAAAAHVQVVAAGVLVVVKGIGEAPPAQGGAVLIALAGVVVDHIEDHLQSLPVAGLHELAHLSAGRQRVGVHEVARMGSHPADRAIAPVVVAAGRCVLGIEGHHRQQFDRRDAQLAQLG